MKRLPSVQLPGIYVSWWHIRDRHRKLARLVADGIPHAEIARKVGVSRQTVVR